MNSCQFCDKKNIKRLDTHIRNAHKDILRGTSSAKKQKLGMGYDGRNFREARYMTVQPRNLQKDGGNLLFIYTGSEQWVDLSATKLKLALKVVKKDGSAIGPAPTVYPIQALHSTIWDRAHVEINNKLVDYPAQPQYTNYLNLLLGTSQETKNTTLRSIGYMSVADRKAMIKNSRTVNFFGPFMSDIFQQQGSLLPPQTDIRINLNAADPKFVLINAGDDATDYTFEIVDIELHFRVLEPNEIATITSPVRIPIGRRLITMNSILRGQQHYTRQDLSGGRDLPQRVYVAFVASSAFLGDKSQDPFALQKYNIKSIALSKSGVDVMGPPYFPTGSMVREYISLKEVVGVSGITLKEFDTSSTVFAFQVDARRECAAAANGGKAVGGSPEGGDLSLNIEFNAATTANLEMVVMCEYAETVTISANKEVMMQ